MKFRTAISWFLPVVLALCFVLLAPSEAWAGPGGIIKAATHTVFGRIILGILTILLLPVIIYYSIKTALQVRKTKQDLVVLSAMLPRYRWLDLNDRVTETFQWVW